MVLDDEDLAERLDELGEPLGIDAIEPGHVHDLDACPKRLGRIEGLVEQHRPVGEEQCVGALAEHGASTQRPRDARELDGTRRGPDCKPERDVLLRVVDRPAKERARLLGVGRLDHRHVRQRAQQ